MADPFGRDGTGGGGDAFGRGSGGVKAPSKPWYDSIPGSKIAANTFKDLTSAAIHVVPGLYDIGKGVVGDVQHGNLNNTSHILGAMLTATLHDLEHPLRHPGNTLLDLWGVTSGLGEIGARAGEIGRISKAASEAGDASKASQIAKAALSRPPVPLRYVDGVQSLYSRNPVVRAGQKLTDEARAQYPLLRGAGKAGKEVASNRRVNEALDKTLPNKLLAMAKSLTAPQHVALRVQAEGVPISERIAYHQAQAAEGGAFSSRAHLAQVKLLEKSRKFIDESSGKPRISDEFPKLQAVYKLAETAAHQRTAMLKDMGFLKDSHRVSAPGQVMEGSFDATKMTNESGIPGQLTVEDMLKEGGVPAHVFQGGEFRVPYARNAAPLSLFKRLGTGAAIPRAPGSVTHAFEGGLLKSGHFRNDTARLVAESYMEADRFSSLLRARDQIIHLASDTPEKIPQKYRQAIRLDKLRGKAFPQAVKDLLATPEEHMAREGTLEHWQVFGHAYDAMRNEIFPKNPTEAISGVKWIDKRMLGGLEKSNPLVGFAEHGSVQKVMSLADAVNNASRLAILYLKPAYAVPNLLGNAAMNIVQQGFAAPSNLARAVRLSHAIGEDVHTVDAMMGEGFTASISGHEGVGKKVVGNAASFWSKLVDLPFRRAAFLHEARSAGFKTPEQIKSLLHDPEHHGRMTDVVRRANKEIIDYGDLHPVERDIIRRVVFFYPWVKGSTKYAGRVIAEHPFQAAGQGVIGQQGATQVQGDLGALPSWAEGLFKVGNGPGGPLVANSSAAAIFQTPADVLMTMKEALGGNATAAHNLAAYLSPVGAAELAALSRQSGTGKSYAPNVSTPQIFGNELVGGLPIVALAHRLEGKQSKSQSYSTAEALLAYLLTGSLTPRTANVGVLHDQAAREKKTGR